MWTRSLRGSLVPFMSGFLVLAKDTSEAWQGFEAASKVVFHKCTEGSNPLFSKGWSGLPSDANQDDVLSRFADLSEKLAVLAEGHKLTPTRGRRPLAQPNKPIQGSTAERKLDVGFVDVARQLSRCPDLLVVDLLSTLFGFGAARLSIVGLSLTSLRSALSATSVSMAPWD